MRIHNIHNNSCFNIDLKAPSRLSLQSVLAMFLVLLLCLNLNSASAQKKLIVASQNQSDTLQINIKNKLEAINYLTVNQKAAFKNGQMEWSVDSLKEDSLFFTAYLYKGKSYYWKNLNLNINQGIAYKAGITSNNLTNKLVNADGLLTYYDKIISYYENNGYPFAKVNMENLVVEDSVLSADINIDPGSLVLFDTISVHGDVKISKRYITQLLDLNEGSPFNQKTLGLIKKRIASTPFLSIKNPTRIEFTNNKAIVHLYLEPKKANFFNGVIGVLPNTNIDPKLSTGNNLIVTGDVQLKIFNTLNLGEKIKINWKRLQALSQELEAETSFNYLFGTPFGFNENFELLKQDTSFLNFDNRLGINYALSSNKSLAVFWEYQSTTILATDNINNYVPSNSNSYGISLQWEELDYPFNPRSGYYFEVSASIGNKEINSTKLNDEQTIFQIQSSNNDVLATRIIPINSPIYKLKGKIDYYFPIGKISTIKSSFYGGWIENDYLFENELNRIGGFKLLRGFDERSIFTSQYGLVSLEYRLLLESNSFISLFYDQAITQQKLITSNTIDYPLGFGAGLNFEINTGIFSISYAIGKQQNNPLEFRSAKIHFGFISLF